MLHVTYKTTDSIKVTTSSANTLEVVIDYSVRNGAAYPGKNAVASIAAATTTTVLAAPIEAESCFDIERMTFSASGGANTITVLRRVSGSDYQETAVTLSSGDVLEYEDGTGYTTKDSNGSAKFSINNVTGNLTVGGTLGVTGAATLTGGVAATLSPSASDGAALGTGSLMWSDLFLADGSIINWNNGDLTLTHSANTLTLAGGALTLGTNAFTAGAISGTSVAINGALTNGAGWSAFSQFTGASDVAISLRKTTATVQQWDIANNAGAFTIYDATAGEARFTINAAGGNSLLPYNLTLGTVAGTGTGAFAAGAITSNGGLQTFGANDTGGAGYRLVLVPNA